MKTMMSDKDLEEYHNIDKAIKKSEKYNYINGKQITDHETGTRVYDVNGSRLPSETTLLGAT